MAGLISDPYNDTLGNHTPNWQVAPQRTQLQQNNSGRDSSGMTTPEQQIGMNAVQSVGQIAATGLNAYEQYQENEKNRKEAEQLAGVAREDKLKQQKIENSINKRVFEQEQKDFALKKSKDEFDLRYNRWITMINKSIESRQKIGGVAQRLFDSMRNSGMQDILLKEFGGK
jgi:hypothetical protein